MLRLIAQKDLLEIVRDGRLLGAGGLVLLLLLVSLVVGFTRQREVQAERVAAQALDYDDWVSQNERHPHDAAHQGMHAFKPEPPLSIVDPGIVPYAGSTIWLQAHRQSELKFRPAQDATGLQRFGTLSAAWVLQVLGPLLVIVLGFNAFAAERERGTLRQTLSLGVSSRQLLWGKAMALAAALVVLFGPAALAAAGVVVWSAGPAATTDAVTRLAWLAFAYTLYFGAIVFVVLGVSARAASSRVALTVLLGIWIATTLMAPRVVATAARGLYPSESRTAFNSSLDSDLSAEYRRVWMEHFGTTSRWGPDLPLNQWGVSLKIDDEAGYGVSDRHFGQLWDTFARQQRFQEWSGLAVPLLAVRAFSMGVSGTDFAHHREFSVAAERHRRLMQDLMSRDLIDHADPLGDRHFAYTADASLWQQVPRFSYAAPSIAWAIAQNARSLAVLAVAFVLAIAVSLAAVPRRLSV